MCAFSIAQDTLATVGQQPAGLPFQHASEWQTLQDREGDRYHQISLLLKLRITLLGIYAGGASLQEFRQPLGEYKIHFAAGVANNNAARWGRQLVASGAKMRPVYQSYEQIQQFSADVAHELRTPLAATRAAVESALNQT